MVMTNFLRARKSVRDFKGKKLSRKELEQLRLLVDEVNTHESEKGIHFRLFENGKIIAEKLQGKAGYSGVMIEAPHYISMEMDDDNEDTLLAGGYALENVNSAIVEKELGTCWITVDKVDEQTKKEVFGNEGAGVDFIIAIGHPKGKKFFAPETASERMEVNEIVFKETLENPVTIDELENLGLLEVFSSVRYAPSHKNSQPWRFLIKGTDVYILMKRGLEDQRSLVDIGVIMFYFEGMAKSMGLQNKWEVVKEEDLQDFKVVAKFNL